MKKTIKGAINLVSAPCGSGKTFATCKHIAFNHRVQQGMYVICSPTIALVDQTATMLKDAGGKNIHCLHGECSDNIQGDIKQAIEAVMRAGYGALLITNAAFDRIPYFPKKELWHLFLDEIPRLDTYYELTIPYNCNLLTEHLELGEYYGGHLHYVKLRDRKTAEKFTARAYDQIDAVFGGIISSPLAGDPCFVDIRSWNKVVQLNDINARQKREHAVW